MRPEQQQALERALEILGEHFETAVLLAQPEPREPAVAILYAGSCHAVASLCNTAANEFAYPPSAEDEEDDDDDDEPGLPLIPPTPGG